MRLLAVSDVQACLLSDGMRNGYSRSPCSFVRTSPWTWDAVLNYARMGPSVRGVFNPARFFLVFTRGSKLRSREPIASWSARAMRSTDSAATFVGDTYHVLASVYYSTVHLGWVKVAHLRLYLLLGINR